MNILLQILEEGTLQSSKNKKVDFKNTIIIMTSNIGARNITQKNNLGFTENVDSYDEENIRIEKEVKKELRKELSPELINRIEDIIVFNKLGEGELEKIAKILLEEVEQRLKSKNIYIQINNDDVKKYIVNQEIEKEYGARELKRVIKSRVEDLIVEKVLDEEIEEKKEYKIEVVENKCKIIKV